MLPPPPTPASTISYKVSDTLYATHCMASDLDLGWWQVVVGCVGARWNGGGRLDPGSGGRPPCKPDSVRPPLPAGGWSFIFPDRPAIRDRSRGTGATQPGVMPTVAGAGQATRFPCSVLHRTGFVMPPRSLLERWALTPPFHPYPPASGGRFVFCDTFRRPRLAPRLPPFSRGMLPCGVRTFLCHPRPQPRAQRPSSRGTAAINLTGIQGRGKGKRLT